MFTLMRYNLVNMVFAITQVRLDLMVSNFVPSDANPSVCDL